MVRASDRRDKQAAHWLPLACLNLSVLFQVMSTGFGKQAALSLPQFSPQSIVSNCYYVLAMVCLVAQSVCWPIALRRYSLSFAYFYMSASYVGILLMSAFLFHEPVTRFNVVGAALIVIGVNVVVRGQVAVRDDAA